MLGALVWYADADADGWGDPATGAAECTAPLGRVPNAGDCDDADPAVSPSTPWYADGDGDGRGDASAVTYACVQPAGHVTVGVPSNTTATTNRSPTSAPVASVTVCVVASAVVLLPAALRTNGK